MRNPYLALLNLLPARPLQIGAVIGTDGVLLTVETPGGGQAVVRGAADIGSTVFFRDGAVEGPAPADLVYLDLEI